MRHAVIMAGGSGTRLWPLSRTARPKQLLDLVANDGEVPHSLLAEAFDRLLSVVPAERIWVCTAVRHGEGVRTALPQLHPGRLILEPEARDTANAVGLAAAFVADADPEASLAVVSADHLIRPVERFAAALDTAFELVDRRPRALVTLAITPTAPATGFGYVERGAPAELPGAYEVTAFREKPDLATAEAYLASGRYSWNAGMFVWRARTLLDALAVHLPETADGLEKILGATDREAAANEIFPTLRKISVDYAVLEPASAEPGRVLTVAMDVDWLDVGSWPALARTLGLDADGNAVRGPAVLLDSRRNVVVSYEPEHLVATVGLSDCLVVHTADVTMVCPVDQAERVKDLLAEVSRRHPHRYD
jgi:mannose-1-phosphate guanylyltransferase